MSKYFNYIEFQCACCNKSVVETKLLDLLDQIREDFGEPIKIASGFRCEKHNKEVGGVANSTHCLGIAADIRPVTLDTEKFDELLKSCQKFSDNIGNGINKGFIHIDTRPIKSNGQKRYWTY